MITNTCAVALSRTDIGEADRLVTLYTETMGKLSVRFVGVSRAKGKLKAFTEPMVWAEYRLYLKPYAEFGKGIGGELIDTFPDIRARLDLTMEAMACCEMLSCLTPERSPNPEKYALICSVLRTLADSPSPWLAIAFGLRLLDLVGVGLEAPADMDPRLWGALRSGPWGAFVDLPADLRTVSRSRQFLEHHVEAQAGRKLKSRLFREALDRALPNGVRRRHFLGVALGRQTQPPVLR